MGLKFLHKIEERRIGFTTAYTTWNELFKYYLNLKDIIKFKDLVKDIYNYSGDIFENEKIGELIDLMGKDLLDEILINNNDVIDEIRPIYYNDRNSTFNMSRLKSDMDDYSQSTYDNNFLDIKSTDMRSVYYTVAVVTLLVEWFILQDDAMDSNTVVASSVDMIGTVEQITKLPGKIYGVIIKDKDDVNHRWLTGNVDIIKYLKMGDKLKMNDNLTDADEFANGLLNGSGIE